MGALAYLINAYLLAEDRYPTVLHARDFMRRNHDREAFRRDLTSAAVSMHTEPWIWGGRPVPLGPYDARRLGRPEIGPAINVRLPVDLLAALDGEAGRLGVSRAEAIRRLVASGLGREEGPAHLNPERAPE